MRKWIAILTILPAIGALTVVNRVEPYILGLPFIIFWSTLWLVLTSACLIACNIMYDRREQKDE